MAGFGWQEIVILTILFGYAWGGYWLYRDARSRGMNGVAWLVALLLFPVVALLIYLLIRPPRLARTDTEFEPSPDPS